MGSNGTINSARIVAIVGFIASLIAIYTFLTGKQSIGDLDPKQTRIPPQTVLQQSTVTSGDNRTDPAPTQMQEANPTMPDIKPQLIESGESFSIEQICNGLTGAEIFIQAPAFPYEKLSDWYIYSTVQDIAGNWQHEFSSHISDGRFKFSGEGKGSAVLLPGNWATDQRSYTSTAKVNGWWGNALIGKRTGLVFPVRDGCITRSTLIAGKLEVGVLDANGTGAVVYQHVRIYCQTKDIAGNFIPDSTCPEGENGMLASTDGRGIATFYLAPGVYFFRYGGVKWKNVYDINISAGETKSIIVKDT
jgi:hypothetical protein